MPLPRRLTLAVLLVCLCPLLVHSWSKKTINGTEECCLSTKLNVAAKKSNAGREFFRRLANEDDGEKLINPENMCNLMHFFIQQAKLNNKSVTFTKGMFLIFDSTNKLFEKFMKAKSEQKSGDGAQYAGYFKRLKHMGGQALNFFTKHFKPAKAGEVIASDTFIYVRGDESSHYHGERGSKFDRTREYPAYGMDIPGACESSVGFLFFFFFTIDRSLFEGMPSGFGHILFGELPPLETNGKFVGRRVYIKPELFGIRELKQFIKHAQSYFSHVSRRYVCQLKDMQNKPGCSKEDAFRENTDKKLLEKWKNALVKIPSVWNVDEQFMKNATKYGIAEIYRQVNELEQQGYAAQLKEFREAMIKQYGEEELAVRKGREIIFTVNSLVESPLACELLSGMKKCKGEK